MLEPGQVAPPLHALPVFVLPVALPEDAADRPVVVVFPGPLASPLARETLAELQARFPQLDRAGARAIAVTTAGLREARDYVPRHHLLFPVVIDADGVIMSDWHIAEDGERPRFPVDPSGLRRAARALRRGVGRAPGWGWRPAAFVVGPGARIAWAWRGASSLAAVDWAAVLGAVT